MKTTMRERAHDPDRKPAGRHHVAHAGGRAAQHPQPAQLGRRWHAEAGGRHPPFGLPLQRSLNTSTGLSDVIVRWKDTSPADTSTLIERANSAGTWSTLTTIAKALDGPQSYVDRNLPADSEWCYRIRIRGANNAEVLTLPRCVVTQKLNDIGVFRAQLRIRVANVSNGGTDGRVAVALQAGPFNIPTGSYTGLKTAIDDLEAGSDVTYDLIQDGITTLRDITRIGVYTGSTDALLREPDPAHRQHGGGLRADVGLTRRGHLPVGGRLQRHLVSHDELRANPLFVNFQSPIMSPLVETDELESRLEAVIGTLIFERLDVDWRNPGVVVSRLTDNTIRANVYLENTDFGGPDIDLQLDVQVAFTQNGAAWDLSFEPVNFQASVDFPWWEEALVALIDPVCVPAAAIAGAALRGLHVAAREVHRPGDQEGLRHPLQAHPGGATGQLRDAGGHRAERWRALLLLRAGADHPHQGHDRAAGPRAGRAAAVADAQPTFTSFCRLRSPGGMAARERPQFVNDTSPT